MAVPQSSALQWYNIVTLRDQNLMLWPLYIFTNMQRLLSYSGIGQKSHIFAVLAYLAAGTSVVQNLQCRPDLNHYYSPNLISHMQTYKEVLKTWAMLWATCSTWPCSRQVGLDPLQKSFPASTILQFCHGKMAEASPERQWFLSETTVQGFSGYC